MKKYLLILLATVSIMVSGCAYRPIPLATSYPATSQQKMQAAHHWDVLATSVADRLKTTIDLTFPDATLKPPIYIRFTKDQEDIPFAKAFHDLLRAQLVQRGVNVVMNTEFTDTLILDYTMQVVEHKDRRLGYPLPGVLTALTGGVWMVAQAIERWQYPGTAAVPFAIAGDAKFYADYYMPGETNTEVVISTTVTLNQQFIFSDSAIYYINDGDYDHYEKDAKTFQMVDR